MDRESIMGRGLTLAIAFMALASLAGCTITNSFGPYHGKVVDAETDQPIEGAAILIVFYTEAYTPAGFKSRFVDAVETMTDSNGDFKIPALRAWIFRAPHRWDPNGFVTVFKPGYGVYPDHEGSGPIFVPNGTIPPNENVTFRLPRLLKARDRERNLGHIPPVSVPDVKMKAMLGLIKNEREQLGLRN